MLLESLPVALIVGTVLGFLTGLGVGGGSLLILWLTLVLEMPQTAARGINLLFFLPCGAVALVIHAVKKRVKWKTVLPCVLGGIAGVFAGTALLRVTDAKWIAKGFALGLIALGVKELFARGKDEKPRSRG